jgi:hypothetical protein
MSAPHNPYQCSLVPDIIGALRSWQLPAEALACGKDSAPLTSQHKSIAAWLLLSNIQAVTVNAVIVFVKPVILPCALLSQHTRRRTIEGSAYAASAEQPEKCSAAQVANAAMRKHCDTLWSSTCLSLAVAVLSCIMQQHKAAILCHRVVSAAANSADGPTQLQTCVSAKP